MEILLIGNLSNKNSRFRNLLAEHFPEYRVINRESVSDLKETKNRTDIHLLVIQLTHSSFELIDQLMDFEELNVPILFVEEEDSTKIESYLNMRNVKGYIRRNAPLERIKKAMSMILEGGVYKEPAPAKVVSEKKKPNEELIKDWTILSMHSKGFSPEETGEVLKIPVEVVKSKLIEIKKSVLQPAPGLSKME